MAAVLVATMPLWLILLESLRPGGDRPHWMAWPGLALGLIGIAILMQPNFGEAGNATALINTGETKPDPDLEPAPVAAWTLVASQVFNLDESLNK